MAANDVRYAEDVANEKKDSYIADCQTQMRDEDLKLQNWEEAHKSSPKPGSEGKTDPKTEIENQQRKAEEKKTVDKLIKTAFESCGVDTDAMDIVKKNLGPFLRNAGGQLRDEAYVKNRAKGLCDNLAVLKKLAADIPGIYEFGRSLLSQNGNPIPTEIFSSLVKAANTVPIDRLLKLSGNSKGLKVHEAVMEAVRAVENIMVSSGADRKLEGSDEREPARQFVLEVMLARCGRTALETLKGVLTSPTTEHLFDFYMRVDGTGILEDVQNLNVKFAMKQVCDLGKAYLQRLASSVHANLQRVSHEPDPEGIEIKWAPGDDPDVAALGGEKALIKCMTPMAEEIISRGVDKHIDKTVAGNGGGADAMKKVLHDKLDGILDADMMFGKRLKANTKVMLAWAVCNEMKDLAKGDFSRFQEALEEAESVTLKHHAKRIELSKNVKIAMDQLAQFVTEDDNAKYDNSLPLSVKNQIHFIMASLSRKTEEAGETGAQIAIDTKEGKPAFTTQADKSPEAKPKRKYVFKMSEEKVERGPRKGEILRRIGLDECFITKPISSVDVGKRIDVGVGSSLGLTMRIIPDLEDFERLITQDFTKFDDTEMKKAFNEQGVENKLENVKFPDAFNFDFGGGISTYSMNLKPTEQELLQQRQNENQVQDGNLIIEG